MTAIVGILNKHAAAMAADSAVTIDGQKVFNSANKLFALSKFKPVAIAFYNNMNLVNCPWEVVTKEYRHYLGSKGFDTLREYVADFFNFLKSKDYFCSEKDLLKDVTSDKKSNRIRKTVDAHKRGFEEQSEAFKETDWRQSAIDMIRLIQVVNNIEVCVNGINKRLETAFDQFEKDRHDYIAQLDAIIKQLESIES